jgi:hypothetical protein
MLASMTRLRAALVHFGISVIVVGAVFVLVYFLWYPEPLFRGAGGRHLFLVLALVDVTVGPLITLIVFKPGKKGLKFDLAMIAILQVAALAFGTYVVYEARPVWTVFVGDRFDLIRANQIVEESREKARPEFQERSLDGPKVAGARMPKDVNERFRIMLTASAGLDVTAYPQHYVPYAEVKAEARAKAKSIKELRSLNGDGVERIDRALVRLGRPEEGVAFLPLRAGKQDLAVLVDAATGDYLGMVDARPWKY